MARVQYCRPGCTDRHPGCHENCEQYNAVLAAERARKMHENAEKTNETHLTEYYIRMHGKICRKKPKEV